MKLTVLHLASGNVAEQKRLKLVLKKALQGEKYDLVTDLGQVHLPCRLMIAFSVGQEGFNLAYLKFLALLRSGAVSLKNSVAGMVLDAVSPLYGKQAVSQLAFALTESGCALLGNPAVEAIGDLSHFPKVTAQEQGDLLPYLDPQDPMKDYILSVAILAQRILGPGFRGRSQLSDSPELPKVTAVLPLPQKDLVQGTSALELWEEVYERIYPHVQCKEISFPLLGHSQNPDPLLYQGAVLPPHIQALAEADALLLVCPNVQNALPWCQLALMQQLKPYFQQCQFEDKALFSLVASSYSSADMLIHQLISTLCLEYGFYLPQHFCLHTTATQALEAITQEGIEDRLDHFAHGMLQLLNLGNLS